MEKRIVAMTTMCVDYFDKTGEMIPGGEALNFAVCASAYRDIRVKLIGALGADAFGEKIANYLKTKPIDTAGVHTIPGGVTANNHIYTDESGDRYFKEDSWNGGVDNTYLIDGDDEDIINGADLVYTTCYSVNLPRLRELRKAANFLLAVDFDVMRDLDRMKQLADCVDIFMISGKEEMLSHFQKWSEECDTVFNITLAEKGSVTYRNGKEYRMKALPVKEVVDTTGCGDSYHAGFLCTYLTTGDIEAAMTEGTKVATEMLSHMGGVV